jgi:outer membrane receptor protein involved in Fe transport
LPEPAVFAGQFAPVTQESVLAYEVGVKESLFDRRASISAATFYYDYRNKQIQGFIPLPPFGSVSSEINIPKSRVEGAELQLDVRPMRGMQLSAAGSYVSSKVTQGPPSAADALGNSINITGEAFPNAPSWQFAANARYEFSLSDSMNAFLGSDASYRTATNAAFGNDVLFKMPSYTLTGVYAGIKAPNDRWSIQIWGRNIFNTFYVTGVTYPGDAISRTTGKPATYGVTLSTRF